ncbi:hypothetical protein [Exiguobacterium sp. s102]|uniref:hypothetical protein n=1 Tax=Exiguobacterium sp. s102 TaxID=2751212 RepID=UPI001BE72BDD|nr:hypothetical protein [Exiguobacterium sp. s102]
MTSEIITKQFKRGMTVEQIATLHGIEVQQVKHLVKGLKVERVVETPNVVDGRTVKQCVEIDLERVQALLEQGLTTPKIAKELGVKYPTLLSRLKKHKNLEVMATENRKANSQKKVTDLHEAKAESSLAAQEVAVTTESDGFSENYTIAHLAKEEADMTEAIAEVKQETEERDVRNDKWVHFVANQIEHAKVKTKFDVVQEGKKFIKRTEVRFVIEEVL